MISANIFEQVELVCRTAHGNSTFFGGIQVVVVGDFRQLKPVANKLYMDPGRCAFQSPIFLSAIPHKVVLLTNHRQNEAHFIDVIKEVSLGHPSKKTDVFLKSLDRDIEEESLHLYPDNLGCADFNGAKLQALNPYVPISFYQSKDTGKPNVKHSVSRHLALKPGAPVMLRVNLSANLINGKIGIITECLADSVKVEFDGKILPIEPYTFELYNAKSKKTFATRLQLPLTLAWAVTIHKAQGLTLNAVTIHCRGIYKPGQLAVGISRVRTPDHLQLIGYRRSQAPQHFASVSQYHGLPSAPLLQSLECCRNVAAVQDVEEPMSSDSEMESSSHEDLSGDDDDDDFPDDINVPLESAIEDDPESEEPSTAELQPFQHIIVIMQRKLVEAERQSHLFQSPPSNLLALASQLKSYTNNLQFLTYMQDSYVQLQVMYLQFIGDTHAQPEQALARICPQL
jgi:ATP-dependent DNA helicase PIF1